MTSAYNHANDLPTIVDLLLWGVLEEWVSVCGPFKIRSDTKPLSVALVA